MFQEFEGIQSEVEASHQPADAKTAQAAAIREAEVRLAVDGVSAEGVVENISALGLEVCPNRLKAEKIRAVSDAVRTAEAKSQQEMVLLKRTPTPKSAWPRSASRPWKN